MKTSLTRSTYTALPAHPLSVSLARTYVTRILADWGRADLTDDAQLVASELLTNAIKATQDTHQLNALTHGTSAGYECHPWIGLHQMGDDVVLEVWDCNRNPPETPHPRVVGGRRPWPTSGQRPGHELGLPLAEDRRQGRLGHAGRVPMTDPDF